MYIGYIGKKNRKEKEITQFNQSVTGFSGVECCSASHHRRDDEQGTQPNTLARHIYIISLLHIARMYLYTSMLWLHNDGCEESASLKTVEQVTSMVEWKSINSIRKQNNFYVKNISQNDGGVLSPSSPHYVIQRRRISITWRRRDISNTTTKKWNKTVTQIYIISVGGSVCEGFRDCAVATNILHDPVFREKKTRIFSACVLHSRIRLATELLFLYIKEKSLFYYWKRLANNLACLDDSPSFKYFESLLMIHWWIVESKHRSTRSFFLIIYILVYFYCLLPI